MPFGTIIASTARRGALPRRAPSPTLLRYLCDGGSRPNPGSMQPLVYNGVGFLPLDTTEGTNHKAVYEAVFAALEHASRAAATDVHIHLLSELVWKQLSGNAGAIRLVDHRDRALASAERFDEVIWHLVKPPFDLPSGVALTAKSLRRAAARQLT